MSRTLRIEVELSDNHVNAIETVKSLLMTDPNTGVSNTTTLEQMYCEMANVGLAVLSKGMKADGTWDKHRDEVELGNDIDDLLR